MAVIFNCTLKQCIWIAIKLLKNCTNPFIQEQITFFTVLFLKNFKNMHTYSIPLHAFRFSLSLSLSLSHTHTHSLIVCQFSCVKHKSRDFDSACLTHFVLSIKSLHAHPIIREKEMSDRCSRPVFPTFNSLGRTKIWRITWPGIVIQK